MCGAGRPTPRPPGPESRSRSSALSTAATRLAPPGRPPSTRTRSYEAFTADPEWELRAICEFLDEPYEWSLPQSFDADEARVAHWEGSSVLYSQVTTTTKNWRDYISERDANLVEELLSPELARFGYPSAVP